MKYLKIIAIIFCFFSIISNNAYSFQSYNHEEISGLTASYGSINTSCSTFGRMTNCNSRYVEPRKKYADTSGYEVVGYALGILLIIGIAAAASDSSP